jgi:hypothetical protein
MIDDGKLDAKEMDAAINAAKTAKKKWVNA